MADDLFDAFDEALRYRGPENALELLIQKFREEKKYPLLFEARLMQSRHALGLPLVQDGSIDDLPQDTRAPHERACIDAAREVGGLFLADGDIPRAWHYFRAIGETAPVTAAIEQIAPAENQEAVIEIAFHERLHPKKGFELILADYGICRAITFFDQYPDAKTRDDCIKLLVRTLHRDLVESLKRVIARNEGAAPDTSSAPELMASRDWLFGQYDYYVDTSHLISIVRFSLDLADRETIGLAAELAEYGKRLSSMFQLRGDPPFEDGCTDYAVYLHALLGEDVDAAIAHFRRKVAESDPEQTRGIPAQVLVELLTRLDRYGEAIQVSLEHLSGADPAQLTCPSVFQLCQMAGDYEQLRKLARERGDLLRFAAAAIGT
jgi:hypothetical protein